MLIIFITHQVVRTFCTIVMGYSIDSKAEPNGRITDQYVIWTIVLVDNEPIKTEIIAEVRLELDSPRYLEWSPVP